MVSELITRSATDLLEQPMEANKWVVEDLVPTGLTLFVGAPKVGKSWACLGLSIAVSGGLPWLGFATVQGPVLYLAMEDTFSRIQQRLFRLVDEANPNLHFAVSAEKLQSGLLDQIEHFVNQNPGTRLIIVDTLQTVRSYRGDNAYAADYADLGLLKSCADRNDLGILVIHHTRKMGSTDVFDTISGTTGVAGSADEAMVLTQVSRCDGTATLSITGRDVEFSEYKLKFSDCRWEIVEKTSREELEEREIPPVVLSVLDFMAARSMGWAGTASELIEAAGLSDTKPNVLAKFLNEHRGFLLSRGVEYTRDRTGAARTMYLEKVPVEVPNEE